MNIEAYLLRINYAGSLIPSVETLRALQVAHLRSVPFENLSIHANEPIVLNDDSLFSKIVEQKRGGFCYELNGLFSALLQALGFQVERLAAGVAKPEPPGGFGPIFDHMTLLVTIEERWLVDVGFGDSFLEPLRLDETREQFEGTHGYRIIQDNSHLILLRRGADNDWKAQYRFTLDSYNYPDYEEMCRFHQTSPDSHFTRGRLCSRATEDGRITLSGMKLITTKGTLRQEDNIASPEEYDRILRDVFGVVMK